MAELTQNEKTELIKEWKETGTSAAEFCRRKRIKATTFYGWIKKEKKKTRSPFVRISGIHELSGKKEIILEKGDMRIHIPSHMIEDHLKPIIMTLSE